MKNNKEKLVIFVGIALIVLVAVITLVRPIFRKKEAPSVAAPEQKAENYPFISVSDLKQKIKNNEKLKVFDTRLSTDFKQEHILDSINVDSDSLGNNFGKVLQPSDTIIIIGSDSGDLQTKLVADLLKQNNFSNFSVLSGGFNSWIENGGTTIRLGNPQSLSDKAKISILKPEDLKSILDSKDSSLFILDIRQPNKFSAEHLPQAKNIPANQLEEKRRSLPLGKTFVFYGETEMESFQYGVTLFDLGFTRSQVLEGGISLWKSKGYATEK